MALIHGLLLALMVFGLIFGTLPASADMAPVRVPAGGGVVAPDKPHQNIRLDSQEVIIRLGGNSYVVDAVFDLFNSGETTTEWTGFPKWVSYGGSWRSTLGLVRFEGSVNGRQIKFDEEREAFGRVRHFPTAFPQERIPFRKGSLGRDRKWLVSRVTFPAHSQTTIRVAYEALYHAGDPRASYMYGTGSLWKGNIGKAVFIVDSTDVGGTARISTHFEDGLGSWQISRDVKAPPRPIADNVLKLELRDFKPHPEALFHVKLPPDALRFPPGPLAPPPPMPVRVKNPTYR